MSMNFSRLSCLDFCLVVTHSPLFESGLEPVLDNVGEPTVFRSTDTTIVG